MTIPTPTAPRATSEPVDLFWRIETPENVVLTYQLAGPSIRLAAYLLDTLFRIVLYVAAALAGLIVGVGMPSVAGGTLLVLLFLMEWAYFVVCEGFFRGRTIGKAACGLRVIQDRGHPVTFWAASIRNLLRAVDVLPLAMAPLLVIEATFPLQCYGLAFLSMAMSRRFCRLGDLAAGTIVISERQSRMPRLPVVLDKIGPLSREEIGGYTPSTRTLALIEEFLSRRQALTHQRGHALTHSFARALARRLNYRGDMSQPTQYPMAFLARVYVTFNRPREGRGWMESPALSREPR